MAIVGDAFVRVRVFSSDLSNQIAREVRQQFRNADGTVDNEGRRTGARMATSVEDGMQQELNSSRNNQRVGGFASDLSRKFRDGFKLGIGADRMGKGIIDAILLAAPSVLSSIAALGASMATELVTALASIGPGVGGALAVAAAGVATLALNFGLLWLAVKQGGAEGKAVAGAFKELMKEIGTPVAKGLLGGMLESVQSLRDAVPQLNDLLFQTGQKFGDIAKGIIATITSADNMSRIKGILSTNISFLDNFKTGITGLTDSFLILFNAAKPLIDFIGQGLASFGQWAAQTLAAKEASGALADTVQGLLDKWKELWAIIQNFGAGIVNVFKAAAPVGAQLLQKIADIGQKFRDWTGDAANQDRMTAFFQKAHDLASAIFDVLGSIFTAGGKAFEGMNIQPILDVLDTLKTKVVPAIADMFNQIKDAVGPKLAQALDNFGTALQKIADSGIIGIVAGAVASLVLAISSLIATDLGSWLAGLGLAWVLFGGILTPIISVLGAVVTALGAAAAPILLVAGALALIWTQSQKFRDALVAAFDTIKTLVQPVLDLLAPAFERLWPSIQRLASAIGDLLVPVLNFLAPIIGVVFGAIGIVLIAITDALTIFADFLTGVLTGDWTKFIADGEAIWNSLKDFFAMLWDAIMSWANQRWMEFLVWINGLWDSIMAGANQKWNDFLVWILGLWNNVIALGMNEWDSFKNWLGDNWTAITTAALLEWNLFVAGLMALWDTVINWGKDRWNEFRSALETIWSGIVGVAESIFNNLVFTIEGIVEPLVGTLQGWWEDIKTAVSSAGLAAIVSGVWEGIKAAIVNPIQAAWQEVTHWVTSIGDLIKGILETVSSAYDTVTSKLADILTKQSQAVAAQAPGGFNSPLMPAAAEGAIVPPVPGGQVILVAEAGRTERIEPLDSQGLSKRDRALISHIMAQVMQGNNGDTGGLTTVQVFLDGRELSGMVKSVVSDAQETLKRQIQRGRRTA